MSGEGIPASVARGAALLERPRGRRYEAITDYDAMRDVQLLAGREIQNWRKINRELEEGGEPLALAGGIAGLEPPGGNVPPDAAPTVTLGATELAIWPTATWTPIAANRQTPTQYTLYAACTVTTTATASPTMTITPRIGLSNAGATLGATPSITLTASQTAVPVIITGEVTMRRTGTGTAGAAFGSFRLIGKLAAPANGAVDAHHIFGFTAATFASDVATGLWMGILSTITTPTIIPQQIRWGSWN